MEASKEDIALQEFRLMQLAVKGASSQSHYWKYLYLEGVDIISLGVGIDITKISLIEDTIIVNILENEFVLPIKSISIDLINEICGLMREKALFIADNDIMVHL
jgi:hypothetical protein